MTSVDSRISQLKKDFKAQIMAISSGDRDGRETISILTDEELTELQNAWIQLALWKQDNVPR